VSKCVIILGAGASADFGVPTLGQLFKDAHAKAYLKTNNWLAARLEEIFWNPRGHDLSTSDVSLTVEEMLTILRDWEKENAVPPKLNAEELARFRKEIYVLIYKALFEGKSTSTQHLNPIINFARKQFEQTIWASFNWDCIFESSFWYSSGDWGPGNRTNPRLEVSIKDWKNGSYRHVYLKLHGSINWWFENNELKYYRFSGYGNLQTKWAQYASEDKPTSQPVILEPSYYKYEDALYNLLKPQWDVFLKSLIEADYVLVAGYSLPTADCQARSKMLTAFQANPKSLWGVIDPNAETIGKYRRLFGETRLEAFNGTVVGFNVDFAGNFQQLFPTFTPKAPPEAPAPVAAQ
jgi:hypothetical protein